MKSFFQAAHTQQAQQVSYCAAAAGAASHAGTAAQLHHILAQLLSCMMMQLHHILAQLFSCITFWHSFSNASHSGTAVQMHHAVARLPG
jgi:hypothetical protein